MARFPSPSAILRSVPPIFAQALAAVLFLLTPLVAAEETTEELLVGVRLLDPFVIETGDGLDGFSIDVWEQIASRAGIEFEYVVLESVQDQIDAVSRGEVDVATTAISITADREEIIDFSHPFYESGLQILVRDELGSAPGAILRALSSPRIGVLFAILIGGTVLLGLFLWLVERKNNEDFDESGAGLFDGIWWAMVTLTTVGYGDKVPRTITGRIITFAWMIFGVVFLSVFTATLASAITLDEFQGDIASVDDLKGRNVVTVAETTSTEFLDTNQVRYNTVDDISSAFSRIESGEADALVFDAPILQNYAAGAGDGIAHTIGGLLDEEYYGIALSQGSPLREPINQALTAVYEDGTHDQILDLWFGEGD